MRASEAWLQAVFQRIDVTPSYPVSLLGYFNDRVCEGVLDPLYCRLAAFRDLSARRQRRVLRRSSAESLRRLLLVQIDTCLFDQAFAWALRRALRAREHGAWDEREVLVYASHTHTAPALARLYEAPRQERYAVELVARIAEAAGAAARALSFAPAPSAAHGPARRSGGPAAAVRAQAVAVSVARGSADGLSFNRRWLGPDGKTVTNPSRAQRARLAGPEGPVDPEVLTLWFRDAGGAPRAAFVSAVNHTDTVGGQRISADWPGVLEREVGTALGAELPVFFLPGAQGNVNHFDPQAERDQTCPEEALRLGRAYAEIVLACLPAARPLPPPRGPALGSLLRRVRLPGRPIPPGQLQAARALLAEAAGQSGPGTLTASELAAGSPQVARLLARELLRQAPERRRSYRVPLQAVRLGSVLLCAIPGEPFVELGLALKNSGGGPAWRLSAVQARSDGAGVPLVLPLGLAGGYYGYILPGERLPAGGYETLPGSGRLGGAAAAMIVEHFRRAARRLP
jgi:neutral ceramidase